MITQTDGEYWWLSFLGEEGWLGATIVKASGIEDAVRVARLAGANPGGEVAGLPIPAGKEISEVLIGHCISDMGKLHDLVGHLTPIHRDELGECSACVAEREGE